MYSIQIIRSCLVAGCFGLTSILSAAGDRPNILMIAVDDLKPLTGAYGDPHAITPAMDALAAQGTLFLNAQCQQAVCGASRASALTGLRPDTTHVWDFKSKMRDDLPNLVTLPQYFKQSGYHTASIGKIFDFRCCDGMQTNDVASWSQPHTTVPTGHLAWSHFGDPATKAKLERLEARAREAGIKGSNAIKKHMNFMPTVECMDENVPDNFYSDGMRTERAIEMLEQFKTKKEPFFLALGYKKPHLPFVAPKKYWDMYDPQTLPLAEYQQMPKDAPSLHYQDSWELRSGYFPIPKGILPEEMQRELIHGYYACVSYIDEQIRQVMQALRDNGLADNTIIILWGDHGWHLGDHGMWCKHTNYEQAARVPLIILDPRKGSQGNCVTTAVEFLDMAPTLADLAGLEPFQDFQGMSLNPLMENPDAPFKKFAISQFARSHEGPNDTMGYAFRNERYRLILWIKMDYKAGERCGRVVARELYDYESDPLETINLAKSPEHADLMNTLIEQAADFADQHMEISWKN
jgi:arylsulfatase A-like enzyme